MRLQRSLWGLVPSLRWGTLKSWGTDKSWGTVMSFMFPGAGRGPALNKGPFVLVLDSGLRRSTR